METVYAVVLKTASDPILYEFSTSLNNGGLSLPVNGSVPA